MSRLTPEQEQALNDMLEMVPRPARGAASAPPAGSARDGLLKPLLGISGAELRGLFNRILNRKDGLEGRFLDWAEANPLDAIFEFMVASSWAFYQAEKVENPKIQTFVDAFYYIATCASVGYADIFAVTQTGRAIAALVMIVGPAMTNKAMDRPSRSETGGGV